MLMTDTVLYPWVYCHKDDSLVFTGYGLSYLMLQVRPWQGIWLITEEPNSATEFNLFPVPAHDEISIEMNGANIDMVQIEVCSLMGTLLESSETFNSKLTLNISRLLPGCYMIRVKKA